MWADEIRLEKLEGATKVVLDQRTEVDGITVVTDGPQPKGPFE